jgi:Domain of unknown function (DUF4260)
MRTLNSHERHESLSSDAMLTSQPPESASASCNRAVSGNVRRWLRIEGFAVVAAAACLYARGGHSWVWFLVLFLAPDLSFVGYALGPRAGAMIYNLFHSYIGPIALGLVLWLDRKSIAVPLIWAAHIGFDRLLGYGLKYATGFADTHLGTLGRRKV